MTRTQISMKHDMLRKAKQRAAELGVSLAEYVRGLVDRDLRADRRTVDSSIIFDLGDSGGSDVARFKDRMIAEALDADHRS